MGASMTGGGQEPRGRRGSRRPARRTVGTAIDCAVYTKNTWKIPRISHHGPLDLSFHGAKARGHEVTGPVDGRSTEGGERLTGGRRSPGGRPQAPQPPLARTSGGASHFRPPARRRASARRTTSWRARTR